ncbi:hypothetical protein A2631_01905 [Candidatus Daviesbacteria bacterium RIFCSPHIGHO2_01_FULL_44_29]|uniref:Uncharacterized protein n=1 Tax=Candidatus Daviesbacteria bacterium RIFCSPHIGHO2_02_FULL_43_12 TaxID=1797776 RepID=A0A1F5KJQ7_9BACT|nr:MAG: hypothetical protein A2631_01905 [Candidatus Daviesbacteria bacterium RIFCSPHIGHO2_01_FULL_44_29]OGE39570.1 MAG: hypothetical protein A3E86_02000 [Candidatus Daviesbacteria bacterium RIFCSPHIGHO2_12_FULL_47_45]OGE41153.1 MAG: hypothetical protein A3D25_01300 [Candidatus Daviesbacteria bacterium RIFCSPHIGHO2_02_FULL_43_12]OGE69352.1 MAG: hypothetical protein A3B55_03040 [Candidatus Daviesbacteria bacterium RIFCSPLOWO2_01_FULL_43_15]
MWLINLTKKTTVTTDAKEALGFWDRMLGLLNNKNPRSLIFYTRFGIHTFGLDQPLDVLVLDKGFRVVQLKENLKPNRLFFWNPRYLMVVELPINSIRLSKTSLGNQLKVE